MKASLDYLFCAISILICLFSLALPEAVYAARYYSSRHPVHVRQYIKKNGTYVHSYYRALPRHHY